MGSANHQSRLHEREVETIRRARAAGTPLAPIAQRFGISVVQVSRIANGKRREKS